MIIPRHPAPSQASLMMFWTLPQFHRSQFMGEMVLLLLICLLLLPFRLQALQFALRHLLPLITHFLLLRHLHLHLHHPLLLFLLTPYAPDVLEMSGCLRNGVFQIATSSLGSQPPLWSPQMMIPVILMIPWALSKLVQPLHLSLCTSFRHSQQCSDADMWQKACEEEMEAPDSMALGRLSSCPLGSVQLAPDGS